MIQHNLNSLKPENLVLKVYLICRNMNIREFHRLNLFPDETREAQLGWVGYCRIMFRDS